MYRESVYACKTVLYRIRMVDAFRHSRTFPARYAPRADPCASGKGFRIREDAPGTDRLNPGFTPERATLVPGRAGPILVLLSRCQPVPRHVGARSGFFREHAPGGFANVKIQGRYIHVPEGKRAALRGMRREGPARRGGLRGWWRGPSRRDAARPLSLPSWERLPGFPVRSSWTLPQQAAP